MRTDNEVHEFYAARRHLSERLVPMLLTANNPDIRLQAAKIRDCCTVFPRSSSGELKPFCCGVSYCPCCHGRTAGERRRCVEAIQQFPADLKPQNVTLTVVNDHVEHLRPTLEWLKVGTRHLLTHKPFRAAVKAYVSKFEVTRADDGLAHTHVHLQVWGAPSTDQSGWRHLWQQSLGVSYLPQGDVGFHSPARWLNYLRGPAIEIDEAMLQDPLFVLSAVEGMHNFRAFDVGGLFRQRTSRSSRTSLATAAAH